MLKTYPLILIFTCLPFLLSAQFFEAQSYDWGEAQYAEREGNDTADFFFLKNKFIYRYHFVDDNFVQDKLFHRQVYLNSPEGIESFNKIYIPKSPGEEILAFRGRAIKGQEVKELREDDIRTGTSEDNNAEYTYAAFEGLEEGTVVEFYYILRENPTTSGIEIEYQYDLPVERFELDVISPDHLVFSAKVYHLADSVQTDTTLDEENRIYLHTDNVPAFKEEVMATSDDNYGRVIFKLDQNLYTGNRNITAYSKIAQNVVDYVANKVELSRSTEKGLDKLLKQIEKSSYQQTSLALRIDQYLKDNFNYVDRNIPALADLEVVLDNQAYTSSGALRLYHQLFKRAGIDYQIVYTSNRAVLKFDPDFQTNNFLNDLLIYLPEEDAFIDFSDPVARNGVINFMLTGTKGLFIQAMELDDRLVAISQIMDIPYRPAKFSTDSLLVDVDFGSDFYGNALNIRRAVTGYVARAFQPAFELISDEDDRLEYTEQLLTYVDEESEVEEIDFKNASGQWLGRKPLVIEGRLKNSEYVETAGPDYLFKIGRLIGPQTEMYYEDTVRLFDIENPYGRVYYREISFTVPEGYAVLSPEKVEMQAHLTYEGKEWARFESKLQQEGKRYTVKVYEYYEGMVYPKEHFRAYAEVINAAADFNKITLLLRKKA